jgi:isopenicillin N synthase-like dioxygenase
MLSPQVPRDFEEIFTAHFQGMTAAPVTAASLLEVRARLLQRILELLDAPSRAFLESVEQEAPNFRLIELPHAADLPGVRRKLANLGQRSTAKRTADYDQLNALFSRRHRV